jgi:uncharacterized protein YyaL (SSP411 family)
MELLSPAEEEKLDELRALLFEKRKARVAPGWDDKVLADWNGLAISALANAGQAFGRPDWIDAAETCFAFVTGRMERDGRLLHSYRAGNAKTPAVANDYANMIGAALALYRARGDKARLADAERWTQTMQDQYWADPQGGYYLSAAETTDIMVRTLSARDDATPNANAIMLGNLAALYLMTGNERYRATAEALRKGLAGEAIRFASFHTGYFSALADHLTPRHVVLIRGGGEEALRDALAHMSLPGFVIEWFPEDAEPSQSSPAFGKKAVDGRATAYVCVGPQCSPPVTDAEALLGTLRSDRIVHSA